MFLKYTPYLRTHMGGTLNTKSASRPLNGRTIAVYVGVGLVALLLANWLVGALSDIFGWPLIIIGAVAFAIGMLIDNKHTQLVGVGAALIGGGLMLLDTTTGFVIKLVKIVVILGIFFVGLSVLVSFKRSPNKT
jgi:hypothetical protein